MKKRKRCIGWAEKMRDYPKCGGVPNRNPLWCDKCDKKRIVHLNKRFAALKLPS